MPILVARIRSHKVFIRYSHTVSEMTLGFYN